MAAGSRPRAADANNKYFMFDYQKNRRFFAQTQHRLESTAREELAELGASKCTDSYCGVYFEAPPAVLYKINYCARTISRVLAPLFHFSCPSDRVLYKKAYELPWSEILSLKQTFAIDSNVSNSDITHSRFAALRLKDAVVDYFRKTLGQRPDVNPLRPDVRLNLNIRENRAVISLDTSGESLHRRGYRVVSVSAPMQETLAAAIIRLSGWQGEKPLLDPLCGSGTLLAEALMKYCGIPAGFKRNISDFGFFHMPDFDSHAWKQVKHTVDKNIRPCPGGLITGSDIDKKAVYAARQNLKEISGSGWPAAPVSVYQRDFRRPGKTENHMIITNPPYGLRIHSGDIYKELGDFLKQQCGGSTAYILCGDIESTKHIGLKISQRIPLYNGPLDARLVKIEIY
jgi:putative N6-adenine-specific DNA methylase